MDNARRRILKCYSDPNLDFLDKDESNDEALAECAPTPKVEVAKTEGTDGTSIAWSMPSLFFTDVNFVNLSYKTATFVEPSGSFSCNNNEIVFKFLAKYGGLVCIVVNAFKCYVQYKIKNLSAINKGMKPLLSCCNLARLLW